MGEVGDVSEKERQFLLRLFTGIDNIINLHFSIHTNDPKLSKIMIQVSDLMKYNITESHISQILSIYPSSYKISTDDDSNSLYISLPDESVGKFSKQLDQRKCKFNELLAEWYETNNCGIPSFELNSLCKKKLIQTQSKVSKSKLVLKKDSSKFKFVAKDSKHEELKNKGLSLLERIKLKEAENKKIDQSNILEIKRMSYIKSKSSSIYNILYQQSIGIKKDERKTVSLNKVIQECQDTFDYPISVDEVKDVVLSITKNLKGIELVIIDNISALRIGQLDREKDLFSLTKN